MRRTRKKNKNHMNILKSFLPALILCGISYASFQLNIVFFQVLAWISCIAMFIAGFIVIFVPEEYMPDKKMSRKNKDVSILLSLPIQAFILWSTAGFPIFWVFASNVLMSIYTIMYVIPSQKEKIP